MVPHFYPLENAASSNGFLAGVTLSRTEKIDLFCGFHLQLIEIL